MAKRELSSTLKNLKFMQRAVQKDEKAKKEGEVTPPAGDSPSCSSARRCIVIMEGDPHPAATSGRMSFLSFNPSIDKLNQDVSGLGKNESARTSSGGQNETTSNRDNSPSQHRSDMYMDSSSHAAKGDLKRKQAEDAAEPHLPNKNRKINQGHDDSSPWSGRHPQKQQKGEKLDWSVLRPPKPYSRKR